MNSRRFDARHEPYDHVRLWLADYCAGAGAGEQQVWQLQLVVEEFFANTVKHGYRGGGHGGEAADAAAGEWPVWITLSHDAGGVHVVYEDAAFAFDPLVGVAPPDYSGPPDTWQVGGLGLPMVSGLARDLRYERAGGRNRLQLTLPEGGKA